MCFAGMKRVAQYASTDRSCVKENEVFVFTDVGRAVWFFLFVSYLCVFVAGGLSSESVWLRCMGCDTAGIYWFSYQ